MKQSGIRAALTLFLGLVCPVQAQWQTQTLSVSNGWTAVYLHVDASDQGIVPATAGVPISPDNPIDQIWLWKTPINTAQYVTTPRSPLAAGGYWVSWGQTNQQSSLATLVPNAAYLIHSTATTNYNWKIKGRPVPPSYTWDMTGLNFLGFQTPVSNPPSLQAFFAQDPAIADVLQIYHYVGGPLSTNPANPAPVVLPQYTPVTRGQAFWLSATNVNNSYFGPFKVSLPNPAGLKYGASGSQLTFHLINETPNPLTVTMQVMASEAPPAGQTAIVGVPPLLLEGAENVTNLTYAYTVLATNNSSTATNQLSWTLAPYGQSGSDIPVVLGVNRFAMTNNIGALYAGIMQFTDSLGFSAVSIPVSATAADTTGLWLGNASVTQVGYDLKTYATNGDGSLLVSAVTNQLVQTNVTATGMATNLFINHTIITNTVVNYYNVTNLVVSTYTTKTSQISTNGTVVSSNAVINLTVATNEVFETDVTGYYYTNNYQLLVWQTAVYDSGPTITSYAAVTNWFYVTNIMPALPVSGTPVAVTNTFINNYTTASYVVTNGIFAAAVTNVTYGVYSVTNVLAGTALGYNVFGTNLVAASYAVTNGATTYSYAVTNAPVVTAYAAVTNYYPSPPLLLVTNGPNRIAINVATNFYLWSSLVNPVYLTNYQVISNNYVVDAGGTNLAGSVTNLSSAAYPAGSVVFNVTNVAVALNITTNPLYRLVTNVLVSAVSNYVVTAYNTNLDAVVSPYPLRLIVFNSTNGTSSLLQRVYFGLSRQTNIVVATTERALNPAQLSTARRITATHLPWTATNAPYYFSGGALQQGATLTTSVTEPYDDQAANPFLHTYHPDHNNLNYTYNPPHELPAGSQSYTVTRVIRLSVVPNANDFLSLTRANTTLSGYYNETITLSGLGGAAKSYQTAGTFTLNQVSTAGTLLTQ